MAKKILIVDDEPDVLKILLLRLKKTGYDVIGARDGREALDLARQTIPDLIILDFHLPDMNGDEVAKMLKGDKDLRHIPIILISATVTSVAERAKECGADGCIAKPFEPEELVGAVNKILKQPGTV
ncbi:MAG: response regulator [Candidatus Omnitrophota bacterium]